MSRFRLAGVVALVTALTAFARPSASSAQLESVDPAAIRQAEATPKGTVAPGLVGAELGAIPSSFSGLNEVWALIVFPVVGEVVGALPGVIVLDKPGPEGRSVAWVREGRWGLESQVKTVSDLATRGLEAAPRNPGFVIFRRILASA